MASPTSPSVVKVAVVDDHPIFCRGVMSLLAEQHDLHLCWQAASVDAALHQCAAVAPDVVLVDLWLADEDGLELVAHLAARFPEVRTLVLSGRDEHLHAERVLRAGARGYVMKDRAPRELVDAIRRVSGGRTWVSESVTDRLLSSLDGRRVPDDTPAVSRLSLRERQVLQLVGQGAATSRIASSLGVSVKTVESHYAHIKSKLGLRTARELTRFAVIWAEESGGA